MIKNNLQNSLNNDTDSYVLPFLWYAGEKIERVKEEIKAIHASGSKEFVLENRGGNWFNTPFWYDLLENIFQTCEELNMKVWILDDSHVNTGSANDTLHLEENTKYRPKNLRIDAIDVVGPITSGAVALPIKSDVEKIIQVVAYHFDAQNDIAIGKGLNLTNNIKDQLLLIDLPEGIYRIYFIINSDIEKNGIFSKYITMMSKESCRHLIDEVHEKLYAKCQKYFGNTFKGFFSDEPAFGNCDGQYTPESFNQRTGLFNKMHPWWDDFTTRLAKEYKTTEEEILLLLPALWDNIQGVSAKLRLTYMDMVTKLWEENFSCQIGKWCNDHNVLYIGHNLEDYDAHMRTGWGCGHYFRSMKGQHMAGMDLVFEQYIPGFNTGNHIRRGVTTRKYDSDFYASTLPKLCASLAHINKHMENRALSEVFGATGWTTGAINMKAMFNLCLSSGVNYFVPHAFSMVTPEVFAKDEIKESNENSNTPPGFVLSYYPPNFYALGFNPQFKAFTHIIKYVHRVSQMTKDTVHIADVALFYNAEAEWMNSAYFQNMDKVSTKLLSSNFDFDFIPSDTLINESNVIDNKLIVNKENYKALIFAETEIIPQQILAKILELKAKNLPIYFINSLPVKTEEAPIDITLLNGIKVIQFNSLQEELNKEITPSLTFNQDYPNLRRYLFKDNENNYGCIIYNTNYTDCKFAFNKNLTYTIYDPWNNQIYSPSKEGNITIQPYQLLIIIFDKIIDNLPPILSNIQTMEEYDLNYDISICDAGKKEFKLLRSNSKAVNLNIENNLTFYCGTIKYESSFDLIDTNVNVLEIPHAGDVAELYLNGQYCGIETGITCRFDISKAIQKGKNTLTIITYDNPAYADRKSDGSITWGSGLALKPHGFTGNIKIGYRN